MILSLGCNLKVQAMQNYEQMDTSTHVQRSGYSLDTTSGRPETPWYNRTVSMKTLLLTCADYIRMYFEPIKSTSECSGAG